MLLCMRYVYRLALCAGGSVWRLSETSHADAGAFRSHRGEAQLRRIAVPQRREQATD